MSKQNDWLKKPETPDRLQLLAELEEKAVRAVKALTGKRAVSCSLDHSVDPGDGEETFSFSVTVI